MLLALEPTQAFESRPAGQVLSTVSFFLERCRGGGGSRVSLSTLTLGVSIQGETIMSSPFVWFHHNGQKSNETKKFFEALLAWKASDGPPGMTMLALDAGPFAALGSKQERYGDRDEWVPFVAVDDVEAATKQALSLGATQLREKTRGPAGEFTVVRDPGGAALALWKKS